MRMISGLVVFITILAGLLALPGTASAKPAGENAFLIEYVDNVEDLVQQVDDSRLLVLRYAKHYKVDPATVVTYFRNELSVEELKEDTTFDVYQRKGTDFEAVTKKFKAGTKVFVNQNGIPILEIGTGNPLLSSLPGKDVKQLPPRPGDGVKPTTPATDQTPLGTKPPETATTTPPASPTDPTVIANNQLPTTVPGSTTSPLGVPADPDTAVLASGPIETISNGDGSGIGRMAGWLLPVGLAGAALLGAGGGGGGSQPSNNDNPLPVPEPATLLALGTGAMSLAGMASRRIRKR